MGRVQCGVYARYVLERRILQPAAQQMERVQCDQYGMDVSKRNFLQPTAQQVERVQCDEYALYVLGRRILQPAAQQLGRVQHDEYKYGTYVYRHPLQPPAPRSLVLITKLKSFPHISERTDVYV